MAVVVSQAAGCIISSSGEDDAVITANWSLQNIATGTQTGCPAGFDTAAVYSQPVNSANQPVGSPIIDLFDCADTTGRTAPLPPDVYQVWVQITSDAGNDVYAQSLSAIVDVIDADKTFSASILNDGGYFSLQWELFDSVTNAPLECSDVPELDGVGVVSTLVANQTSYIDDKFTCANHYGVTGGLLAGTYTVEVDAFSDTTGSVSPAPVMLDNRVINTHNAVTDLGTVNIPID